MHCFRGSTEDKNNFTNKNAWAQKRLARFHRRMPSMKNSWIFTGIAVCLVLLAVVLATITRGQAGSHGAPIMVDDTHMGSYRALAELSHEAFEKGDVARAAVLARILERTWDKGE